ncbi:hypothetical protein DL93DRAFT_2093450 [Clavulina sp. PMI_390]|nr:hypothetical protein DL93DRAFT_2093450 [Clavulina sp. PMI_390]
MASDRPLYLHISALSPDEYDVYTAVLRELAGPGQDDTLGVSDRPVDIMEARGWIRGRYGLDAALVDKILRYFQPSHTGRQEVLSAGQFFAVLRLVLHVQAGRDPAKALVFVQPTVHNAGSDAAHNGASSTAASASNPIRSPPQRKQSLSGKVTPSKPPTTTPPTRARGPSDPTRTLPPPLPATSSASLTPRRDDDMGGSVSASSPVPPPRSANPFIRRTVSGANMASADQSLLLNASTSATSEVFEDPAAYEDSLPPMPITAPPVHPLSRSAVHVNTPKSAVEPSSGKSSVEKERDSLSDTALAPGVSALRPSKSKGTNPFSPISTSSPNPLTSSSSKPATTTANAAAAAAPTVPPRRPPALPPRSSDVTQASLVSLTPTLPPRPSKPSGAGASTVGAATPQSVFPPLASSMLIKESLRAAKAQKATEGVLEKQLNWEVIKRSSSRDSSADGGGGPPAIPPRNPSPPRPPRRAAPEPPISGNLGASGSGNGSGLTRSSTIQGASFSDVRNTFEQASSIASPNSGAARAGGGGGGGGSGYSTPTSAGGGLGRSKSMHQPSPSLPQGARPPGASYMSASMSSPAVDAYPSSSTSSSPSFAAQQQQRRSPPVPPPPPRRRPESFQALSSPMYGSLTGTTGSPNMPTHLSMAMGPSSLTGGGGSLGRRASLHSNTTAHSSHSQPDAAQAPPVHERGPGDAFANLYESVKKKAENLQPSVKRIAERAEGRMVPGGYIHPRRGSHRTSRGGTSERRGLVDGDGDGGEDDGEGGYFGDEGYAAAGGGPTSGGYGELGYDRPGSDHHSAMGLGVDSGSPGVDVDEGEWREWDRTVRSRGRHRTSLSTNDVGMDEAEGGGGVWSMNYLFNFSLSIALWIGVWLSYKSYIHDLGISGYYQHRAPRGWAPAARSNLSANATPDRLPGNQFFPTLGIVLEPSMGISQDCSESLAWLASSQLICFTPPLLASHNFPIVTSLGSESYSFCFPQKKLSEIGGPKLEVHGLRGLNLLGHEWLIEPASWTGKAGSSPTHKELLLAPDTGKRRIQVAVQAKIGEEVVMSLQIASESSRACHSRALRVLSHHTSGPDQAPTIFSSPPPDQRKILNSSRIYAMSLSSSFLPLAPIRESSDDSSSYMGSSPIRPPPRRTRRSPSMDSLPALSAPSPGSSAWWPSSPVASTPPDSPVRAHFGPAHSSRRPSSSSISPSSDHFVQPISIKRSDDDYGLQLLLQALETESGVVPSVKRDASSASVTVRELRHADTSSTLLRPSTPKAPSKSLPTDDISVPPVNPRMGRGRISIQALSDNPSPVKRPAPSVQREVVHEETVEPPVAAVMAAPVILDLPLSAAPMTIDETESVDVSSIPPSSPSIPPNPPRSESGPDSLLVASPPSPEPAPSNDVQIALGSPQPHPVDLTLPSAETLVAADSLASNPTTTEQQPETVCTDDAISPSSSEHHAGTPPLSPPASSALSIPPLSPPASPAPAAAVLSQEQVVAPSADLTVSLLPESLPPVSDVPEPSDTALTEVQVTIEPDVEYPVVEVTVAPSNPIPESLSIAETFTPLPTDGTPLPPLLSPLPVPVPVPAKTQKTSRKAKAIESEAESQPSSSSRPRKRQRRISDIENLSIVAAESTNADAADAAQRTTETAAKRRGGPNKRVKRAASLASSEDDAMDIDAPPVDTGSKKGSKTKGKPRARAAAPLKQRKASKALDEDSQASSSTAPAATTDDESALILAADGSDPCAGLDMPALLIDALVFGRLTFLSAPDLAKNLMRDHPHLLQRLDSLAKWTIVIRRVLEQYAFFVRISRHGLDPDGNKLEDTWYYEPSQDPDRSRAETMTDMAPSKRRKAKMGDRTYFYAPIDMNRWVVAAELGDDA